VLNNAAVAVAEQSKQSAATSVWLLWAEYIRKKFRFNYLPLVDTVA